MTTRFGAALLLSGVLSIAAACSRDPLYCDENTPCTIADRPWCDLEGVYPGSDGHGRTCVPCPWQGQASGCVEPPDAGAPDAVAGEDGMAIDVAPPVDGSADSSPVDASPPAEVTVTGSTFMMGCNAAIDVGCYANESPYHMVILNTFMIDRTEVTHAAWKACMDVGVCTAPPGAFDPIGTPDLPVGVWWNQAAAFCARLAKRLPTEAEWELAARGLDGRIYPWGNQPPTCTLANMSGCGGAYEPVGSHLAGASPWGALDMAGNAHEWVNDFQDDTYYSTSPVFNPQGPGSGTLHVCRGGSYDSAARPLRVSMRNCLPITGIGFRCARNP